MERCLPAPILNGFLFLNIMAPGKGKGKGKGKMPAPRTPKALKPTSKWPAPPQSSSDEEAEAFDAQALFARLQTLE